jgi:hypothetical protein
VNIISPKQTVTVERVNRLKDKIYFTRLSRIQASKRLLFYKKHSEFLLVEYTVFNIFVSYLAASSSKSHVSLQIINDVALGLSIALLAFSLFISKNRFSERASSLQEIYNKLDYLYAKLDDCRLYDSIYQEYVNILNSIENHTSRDYVFARVEMSLTGKQIAGAQVTRLEYVKYFYHHIIEYIIVGLIYIVPFILLYVMYA